MEETQTSLEAVELQIDTTHAVEIAKNVYWFGFYDEEEKLHCNPFLIKNGPETILIDPGSLPHFPVVARKAFALASADSISSIVLQHQDPDLCAAVPIFEDLRENAQMDIYCAVGTSYLIHHYGIKGTYRTIPNKIGAYNLKTKGGRDLDFYWTPYAHSFGAMMTHDKATNTLFTSDILGGVGSSWALYHDQPALDNMKAFMQLIMPSNKILRYALQMIRDIDPEIAAPQHGQILRRRDIAEVIAFLWDLPCGIDLIDDPRLKTV